MPLHRLFSDLQLLKSSTAAPGSSDENEVVQKQQRSLAFILDSIADGVIATDLEGRVSYMNRVTQQLTGWTLLETFGLALSEVFKIVDGENEHPLESPFEATMTKGRPVALAPNLVLVSRVGTRFSIEGSAAPIRDRASSAPSGMVLIFRDVTEQRKMAVELQETKKLETIRTALILNSIA